MTRASDSGGFTLVELLVATTLLALLAVVLFGGLRFGARAWEAGDESLERTGDIEAVQELLRRTLVDAAVPDLLESGEQAALAGASDRVGFFAPLPRHAEIGGLGRYALALDESGQLLLAWEPRRPERRLDAPLVVKPATLLPGVRALSIAYYGSPAPGEAPVWRDRWSSRALPLLVRIDLAFAEPDPRRWPELIVAPRLAKASEDHNED